MILYRMHHTEKTQLYQGIIRIITIIKKDKYIYNHISKFNNMIIDIKI